jgi:hypothetical protein
LVVVAAVAGAAPRRADAQNISRVGFNTAGLVSIQPVDHSYVSPNGPYLDRGLGGLGPGVAMGVDVVKNRLALVFEYNTAWLSVAQEGRLVNGGSGTGRLRDSMLTALARGQVGHGRTRAQLLGGLSYRMGTPSSMAYRGRRGGEAFRVLTFGTTCHLHGPQASLLVTGRACPWIQRGDSAQQLGIGRHVFRVGAGIRLSISKD